jgi:DNA polymerase-1
MPQSSRLLLLIDGYGLIYRSFYAIPNLATDDGRPVNAIFGFLKSLRKLLAIKKPTHAAVVMDEGEPSARLKQLPSYKATRQPMPVALRPQIEPIKRLIPLCGVHLLGIEGVEADDIIGTLTQQALKRNFRVVIYTNDKDLMQLVNDRVVVINPAYPDKQFDATAVLKHYGVRPDQIVDYLALVGDSVDNRAVWLTRCDPKKSRQNLPPQNRRRTPPRRSPTGVQPRFPCAPPRRAAVDS